VKVGLEETLVATMMRTGANIVAPRTGLIDVPKFYVLCFSDPIILSIWYFVNFKTEFIQSIACAGPCRNNVKS